MKTKVFGSLPEERWKEEESEAKVSPCPRILLCVLAHQEQPTRLFAV